MLETFKKKISEKIHIIFVVVMIIYLSSLSIKTVQVYYEEFYKKDTSAQTAEQKIEKPTDQEARPRLP